MPLLKIEEPSQEKQEIQDELPIIGIDLGTTNSLVGVVINENVRFFKDEFNKQIHKSVVAFDDLGAIKSVGNKADFENEENKIYSIKRFMGRGFADIKDDYEFEIEPEENSQNFKIKIAEKKYSPEEISSFILKYLKDLALDNLGFSDKKDEEIKAVITVPAYFDEAAKTATKFAAKLAKIDVIRLVNEPTAAALAYGLDSKKQGIYLVYDLGGGTFDVSVLKMMKGVFKVLGVSGNNNLGGDDFDEILAQYLAKKFDEKIKQNFFIDNKKDKNLLKKIAKTVKENFSQKSEILVGDIVDNILEKDFDQEKFNKISDIKITKQEFEQEIAFKVDETIEIAKKLIEDLDLEIGDEKNEIQGLILVGGSSRIDLIQSKLKEIFGENINIFTDLDPDCVVAQGAVLQAYNLSGANSNNLLLDVLPLSLGIEMMGGIVDKIISRNTTIPTAYAKEFTTYADNQTGMKFKIVQGEREFAKDCRALAEFEVKNIPPLRAGLARVLVTFKVDADGLLTVSSEEKMTGQKQEIEVKPTFGLDEEKVKEMLVDSLQNSKSDIALRLKTEAIREANQNIYFIERDIKQYHEMLEETERKLIEEKISQLKLVLNNENADKEEIVAKQKELEKSCENFVLKKMDESLKKYVGQNVDEVN